jgi:cyclophilin family peptidyl-prolyl cis-trans isomerase/HEAT repeat protein
MPEPPTACGGCAGANVAAPDSAGEIYRTGLASRAHRAAPHPPCGGPRSIAHYRRTRLVDREGQPSGGSKPPSRPQSAPMPLRPPLARVSSPDASSSVATSAPFARFVPFARSVAWALPRALRDSCPLAVAAALALATLVTPSRAPLGAQKVSPVRPGARPVAAAAAPAALTAAERSSWLAILSAEDSRARGANELRVIVGALDDPSPTIRRVAVRALGRLQRPSLLDSIGAALVDRDSRVRIEGVNAIGQAMQGARALPASSPERRALLDEAVDMIVRTAERYPDPLLLGVAARTLGRLPYADSIVPREVERVIVEIGERPGAGGRPMVRTDERVAFGVLHGLYALARTRRVLGPPSERSLAAMRWATTFGIEEPFGPRPSVAVGTTEANARVRRLAYLGLSAAGDTSAELTRRAVRDPDEQVRRLAVVWSSALQDTAVRRAVVGAALRDPSFVVRFEAVRAYRALPAPKPCTPLITATFDANPHVQLAAIDGLGGGCDDHAIAADTLLRLIDTRNAQHAVRQRGTTSWHAHAHALAALARVAPATAVPLLRRDARHPLWQVRLYVARAALAVRDTMTLTALAYDPDGNVREAALEGIAATVGHVADRVFAAALAAKDYQVVLQAAQALKGAPIPDSVVPAIMTALERLTAEQRENSRDPRLALLDRLGELGSARLAPRLAPLVADFDSTVAQRAATIMERWTLRRAVATPTPLARPNDQVAMVLGSDLRLLVKMAPASGGGSFVVRLFPDEAPATVARIVRLARAGYYAGLTFHRVEPTFVIQGGSPAATEYVGDGPFMRDEVGLLSHLRGTLGISTRGRDTGDAQLFVNLTDNARLDHDYTVLGEIIQGREVAEGIIEGDVIERVDVVRAR